jgi:hypothetical protein
LIFPLTVVCPGRVVERVGLMVIEGAGELAELTVVTVGPAVV